MSARVLLALCALAQLAAANDGSRCMYGAAGDLVGHQILLNHTKLAPASRREYVVPVIPLPGCLLNGVSARACDLFAPEVEVSAALDAVLVRRLGPRLRALTFDLSLYCDPLIATTR